MDDVQPSDSAPREEMDEESADVHHVHIHSTTVKHETRFWHDAWPVVHIVRESNTAYTMCHRWISVLVENGVQRLGYTDAAPNCLLCLVIER